jgi:VanZ family protein
MLLKPGVENKEYPFMFPGIDKLLHYAIFLLLGFLLLFAYPKIKILWYFIIMIGYGLLTEILQSTMQMGRSAEFLDLLADTLAAITAWFGYKILVDKLKAILNKGK